MTFNHLIPPIVLAVWGQAAVAGCVNYLDGSSGSAPLYEICYNGSCDTTALTYECANQFSFQNGFAVGWSKECDMQTGRCTVFWEGRPIDDAKLGNISCTPLADQDVCNFP